MSDSLIAKAWSLQCLAAVPCNIGSRTFGGHFSISDVAVMHVQNFAILLQGSCMKHKDCQIV